MVTPLKGRDELDCEGLERLIEHLLSGGVAGLFILGTTGEGPSLGYALRESLIERTCAQVANRVPILVGITDTAFVESLKVARVAARAGASAVVLAPPYYLPEAQPELQEYLDHLIPELPLPLFLYNMPALTKVSIEPDTIRKMMDYRQVIGFKDSSGDMGYFKKVSDLIKARPDWSLLVGPEERLLDSMQLGGNGGVSGGANMFPALYVKLAQAFVGGDLARARELQNQIQRVSDAIYRVGRHSSAIIKGIKCVLACRGVCQDFMAEPFHRFRQEERQKVRQNLALIEKEIASLNL